MTVDCSLKTLACESCKCVGRAAFDTVILVVAQLWRIDRFGLLFDHHQRPPLSPAEFETTEG